MVKAKANKRKPEEATPWAELKDGVLAANEKQVKAAAAGTPNKKVLDERQKNYEKFLSEDIKNNTTFDTLKDKKPKKGAPIVAKKQESSSDDSSDEEELPPPKQTPKINGKANGNAKPAESSSEEDSDDSDDEPPPAKVAKPGPVKQNGKAPAKAAKESSSEEDSDDSDDDTPAPPAANKSVNNKATPAKVNGKAPAPAESDDDSSEEDSDEDDDEPQSKAPAVKGNYFFLNSIE